MYIIYQSTRRARDRVQGKPIPNRARPAFFPRPGHAVEFRFTCKPCPDVAQGYLAGLIPMMTGLARILQHLTFVNLDNSRPGITWPELYLLSHLATGQSTRLLEPINDRTRLNIHRRLRRLKADAVRLFPVHAEF